MQRQDLTGFILLNKPYNVSSNHILQKVKYLFRAKKAGHTGTLDVLATGMLPICFGEATKFSSYLLDSDKQYRVVAKLGEKRITADAEGEVIKSSNYIPTIEEIEQAIQHYTGPQTQVPSMYSALKHNGKPLYEYARNGIEIERQARNITVYKIDLLEYTYPFLTLHCSVSKGTYIRNLVEDIGEFLGCEAYTYNLHRTTVHDFAENLMLTIEDIQQFQFAELMDKVIPIEKLLAFKNYYVNDSQKNELFFGRKFPVTDNFLDNTKFQLIYQNRFLGVGEYKEGYIFPKRMLQNI